MRTTTAYFAGVGTVAAAVVAGLGAGLLMANIASPPKQSAEMTKLEQRMSSKSIPVVNAPSEPVSYLAATEPAASGPITVAPPAEKQQQPSETVKAAAVPAQPAEAPAVNGATTSAPPALSAPSTVASVSTSEQVKPSEDASAKTRSTDVARDTDVRREAKRAEEKRNTDRRQQWTERRRNLRRQDQELRDVEQKVREETESARAFAAEPVKMEGPRIRLFGDN